MLLGPGALGRAPGVYETFEGRTELGPEWTDAADVWGPGMFDRALIVDDGVCGVDADTISAWEPPSTWVVGHSVCARPMGSVNGEVSVRWNIAGSNALSFTSQVGPAFGLDLEAADPLQMGVTFHWDISLGQTTYAQNVFRSPVEEVFDYPSYYRPIESTIEDDLPALVTTTPTPPNTTLITPVDGQIWVTTRVVDGEFSTWWNGLKRHGPTPVPEWALGRDSWGWQAVSIHCIPDGRNFPNTLIPVNAATPARWDAWCWRPYDGPL